MRADLAPGKRVKNTGTATIIMPYPLRRSGGTSLQADTPLRTSVFPWLGGLCDWARGIIFTEVPLPVAARAAMDSRITVGLPRDLALAAARDSPAIIGNRPRGLSASDCPFALRARSAPSSSCQVEPDHAWNIRLEYQNK